MPWSGEKLSQSGKHLSQHTYRYYGLVPYMFCAHTTQRRVMGCLKGAVKLRQYCSVRGEASCIKHTKHEQLGSTGILQNSQAISTEYQVQYQVFS